MDKRGNIIALYQYIAEVVKSIKTEKKDIHNEEWCYFLEDLPKYSGVTLNYLDNKNTPSDQKILQVEKIPFLEPLAIDKELLDWLSGDWGDYKSPIKLLSEKIIKENDSTKVVNISKKEKEILRDLKYYKRISKMLNIYDNLILKEDEDFINGVFHRRKTLLKFLIKID